MIKQKEIVILLLIGVIFAAFIFANGQYISLTRLNIFNLENFYKQSPDIINNTKVTYLKTHPLVEAAKNQIGVVTKYDSSYYQGGYPPEDSGACTDLVERALRESGYPLKDLLDKDMRNNPSLYPQEFDSNINFRRVRNLKIFLDRYAEVVSTCTTLECFKQDIWRPGDIVTYEQIPNGLWHIAIISNKVSTDGLAIVPYIIHNHGRGAVENNLFLIWPAPISGHYRINDIDLSL